MRLTTFIIISKLSRCHLKTLDRLNTVVSIYVGCYRLLLLVVYYKTVREESICKYKRKSMCRNAVFLNYCTSSIVESHCENVLIMFNANAPFKAIFQSDAVLVGWFITVVSATYNFHGLSFIDVRWHSDSLFPSKHTKQTA